MNGIKKVFFLLDRLDRLRSIKLLLLMLISVFLETLGVGLILPILTLMIESDVTNIHPLFTSFYIWLGSPDKVNLISIFLLIMVVVFIVKNIFISFYFWHQFDFVSSITGSLGKKLLKQYLSMPYTEHVKRNSSIYIRNTTREVGFFNSLLSAYLMLVIESLMIIFISILLLIIHPTIFIFISLTLFTSSYLFYLATSNRVTKFGKDRLYHEGKRIYTIQESIGAIRDIIIRGKEDFFLNEFDFHNKKTALNERNYDFVRTLPRLFIETIVVIIFAIIIAITLKYYSTTSNLLPIFGLFAGAAIKLMPSLNRIITSLKGIKYNNASINTIYDELNIKIRTKDLSGGKIKISFRQSLTLKHLSFEHNNPKKIILDNVNLKIISGSSIGLVGESGVGKSTIIDLITGLIEPDSGEITADGENISQNIRSWQDEIGYVSQNVLLLDDSLKKNIVFGVDENDIDYKLLEKSIQDAQLNSYVNSLPDGIETNIGEKGVRISGGQRQRVAIARILYFNPSFLIFDESTSALDIATEKEILDVIFNLKGKKTIFIVSHRLSTIAKCDFVYKIENGNLLPIEFDSKK
jgi:ABC-type multidrug transport system fused ATPase/permease subunit